MTARTRLPLRFLKHPAHAIALGMGSGLSRFAPGTVGTLWAWLLYKLVLEHLSDPAMALWLILACVVGWWACKRTMESLQSADPGCIVWDEMLAFWLVLWLLAPASWGLELLAFALFRFFDAAKPQPVRWADQYFKGMGWRGAWGVLWDDLIAAACTLLVLACWLRLFD